jgi:16S rRNA processing protein RimM
MGRIVVPFGVKGWFKVHAFTETPESLLGYESWWIGTGSEWRQQRVEQAKVQSGSVVAKLEGCEDRDAAARLRGQEIAIPRGAFPAAAANEYYWADLVGLQVVNTEGIDFGAVSEIIETGANDVLVVKGDRERLIPFIEQVIREVDIPGRSIRVDWGADY